MTLLKLILTALLSALLVSACLLGAVVPLVMEVSRLCGR